MVSEAANTKSPQAVGRARRLGGCTSCVRSGVVQHSEWTANCRELNHVFAQEMGDTYHYYTIQQSWPLSRACLQHVQPGRSDSWTKRSETVVDLIARLETICGVLRTGLAFLN